MNLIQSPAETVKKVFFVQLLKLLELDGFALLRLGFGFVHVSVLEVVIFAFWIVGIATVKVLFLCAPVAKAIVFIACERQSQNMHISICMPASMPASILDNSFVDTCKYIRLFLCTSKKTEAKKLSFLKKLRPKNEKKLKTEAKKLR